MVSFRKGSDRPAAIRLPGRLVPCSVVGTGPSGMVEVLVRFGRPGTPLHRLFVHSSRLLHSLPPRKPGSPPRGPVERAVGRRKKGQEIGNSSGKAGKNPGKGEGK
ncbi:MAG: hypothetical protein M1537_01700 [Nitrospirae bacterium]|nr:hypothetical protein [Nitrospirota bacterium]MCL5284183.1 hypothetical protein [Nitrospirota bacterium]